LLKNEKHLVLSIAKQKIPDATGYFIKNFPALFYQEGREMSQKTLLTNNKTYKRKREK